MFNFILYLHLHIHLYYSIQFSLAFSVFPIQIILTVPHRSIFSFRNKLYSTLFFLSLISYRQRHFLVFLQNLFPYRNIFFSFANFYLQRFSVRKYLTHSKLEQINYSTVYVHSCLSLYFTLAHAATSSLPYFRHINWMITHGKFGGIYLYFLRITSVFISVFHDKCFCVYVSVDTTE